MTCDDVRERLLEYQRGQLEPATQDAVRAHLDGCADCTHADTVEQELSRLLERRLPQHPAPVALKRRLAERWTAVARPRWRAWRPASVAALVAAALVLTLTPLLYYQRLASSEADFRARMVAEAVSDHLRVLVSQRPLEIESGGMHQVRPWFEGRLDFAPRVPFEGDAEFPLKGGAVGYFLDRKAAVFVYGRRLHQVTLLVFRSEGLPWQARASVSSERGFTVVIWRRGELGYALVSDIDTRELEQLATRLGADPPIRS